MSQVSNTIDGPQHGESHVALVSGGMDSTVAATVAVNEYGVDLLAYLDTRTGLDENVGYLEELADFLGVQLWTLRTDKSYEDRVHEHGFPGPGMHRITYIHLKQRQLRKLATLTAGYGNKSNLHLWTGVRSSESKRRMANVEAVDEAKRWTWVSPIHDWSKDDCREYIKEHGTPRNDLWDELGRSGDCFCGCYGNPEEKIDLCAAGCEYQTEWIEDLEESVEFDGEKGKWAGHNGEGDDTDDHMSLCSHCGEK